MTSSPVIQTKPSLKHITSFKGVEFYPTLKGKENEEELGLSHHLKNRVVGDYIVIARDFKPPTYAVFDSKPTFLHWYNALGGKEKNFFEVLIAGAPRRLYWDFDWKVRNESKKDDERKKCEDVLRVFMESVIGELKETFNADITLSQFLIKTSHGITERGKSGVVRKYSWHLLIPSLGFKEPTRDFPAFNELIRKRMDRNSTITVNQEDWKTFPDPSVYKSTQLFRLAESTKDFQFFRPAKILKEFVTNGEKVKYQWNVENAFLGVYKDDTVVPQILPSFSTKVDRVIEVNPILEDQTSGVAIDCSFKRYNYTLEDIEQILNHIGNEGEGAHYDIYLKVGMALHHFFEGENDGLKLWKLWCKRSAKYNEHQTDKDYDSFFSDRENPVTIYTILGLAKEENPNSLFDFNLMKKECSECSKFTRYSELTIVKGSSLCSNCINDEEEIIIVKCDSESLDADSQPLPLYLDGKKSQDNESPLDLAFLNETQRLNFDDNVKPHSQEKEDKKESQKEDKEETDESRKRKAEEAPENTEKKKKVKLIDENEGDNFFSEEEFELFNNEILVSLQWRGECKLIQSQKIFSDLITKVIAEEDVEKYHELKLLTWLRLNFTQVCDVEYFVNQFQILKKQTTKADCDVLFDSLVKYLARYVVITRQDELTLWMLKDANNNLVWFPYSLESMKKKFSKTSAKIIFEIENKEKKRKALSAPVNYTLVDALLTHDWRITASFISADSTKPLMYIEKFQNKDQLYFNTAISRRYTNKEIIKKVESEVPKEKIEEAHQIWEEILNESLSRSDELSKKTLIYWCTRHFIEEPKERTRASLMVTGLSGTGKSSFFEWTFKTAFGGAYVKREAPTLGLGFMEELIGKQVVFLDEVKINSAHDYNVIKNLVTSDTTVLRAMYKSASTVPWNGEIIMVANDRYPIKFESQDERRFKKIITSDKKKGPKFSAFWEKAKSLAELAGGLMWAYFLVKPLENEKYREEVRTFNFDNIQLKANLETAYDKLPLIAKFIMLIYTDPEGDIGSWYTKEGRKEPKLNIFTKFEQYQEEFSVADKQKLKFETFIREMEDLIFDPKQKIDGRNPRNYLILFDKDHIRENFMRRFGGVDPKPEEE